MRVKGIRLSNPQIEKYAALYCRKNHNFCQAFCAIIEYKTLSLTRTRLSGGSDAESSTDTENLRGVQIALLWRFPDRHRDIARGQQMHAHPLAKNTDLERL